MEYGVKYGVEVGERLWLAFIFIFLRTSCWMVNNKAVAQVDRVVDEILSFKEAI